MSLAAKMVAIMGEVERLGKDARNAFHKYAYTSDNMVYDAVRKAMINNGVAIFTKMPQVEQIEGKTAQGKPQMHTLAHFVFVLVDTESGEREECEWFGEADDQSDKGVNKCATAALKYFLLKTFVIPTGDDPDAGSPTRAPQRKQAPPPAQTDAPEARNAEYEAGMAEGAHDWATDERLFATGVCEELKQAMVDAGVAEHKHHAAAIILQAMKQQHGDGFGRWSNIYKEFTASAVYRAVAANRGAKAAEGEG